MKFSSRKDGLFTFIVFSVCSLLISMVVFEFFNKSINIENLFPIVMILCAVAFLLWLHFGTNYEITQTTLKYRSGPIYGEIPIKNIKEIIKNKTLWVGLKPATATKGLIIKYNKFNEIYISPNSNDSFINKIVEINGNIKITEP